jgi:hypothetical protein
MTRTESGSTHRLDAGDCYRAGELPTLCVDGWTPARTRWVGFAQPVDEFRYRLRRFGDRGLMAAILGLPLETIFVRFSLRQAQRD